MNQKAEVNNIAGHYLLGHIPLIGKNEKWFPLIEFRGANEKKLEFGLVCIGRIYYLSL